MHDRSGRFHWSCLPLRNDAWWQFFEETPENQQNEQTTKDQPAKHNKDGDDDGDGVDSGYC